jgi:Mg-chelatase subunit ChlD
MEKKHMHITVVLDRSGSMNSIRDDIVGGVNSFLERQRVEPGGNTITLVQFDTEDPFEVIYSFVPVATAPSLSMETYQPRGGTPLLDATGRTIINLESWLGSQAESDRPEKLVVVVVTDGQENSSREFSLARVKQLIAEKQEKAGWQFVYLSADLDAVNDAINSGFARDSVMAFDKSRRGTTAMFKSLSDNVALYCCESAPAVRFSKEDRAKQESEQSRT